MIVGTSKIKFFLKQKVLTTTQEESSKRSTVTAQYQKLHMFTLENAIYMMALHQTGRKKCHLTEDHPPTFWFSCQTDKSMSSNVM